MTDGDATEQDRAFLRQIGAVPTDRKPVSVWFAQALCVVFGALTTYFAFRIGVPSALFLGALGLLYLALVVGVQKRHSWARWTIVAILTLGACGSALQLLKAPVDDTDEHPGQIHIAPNERSGAAVGRMTSIILMLVLGLRLGFGEPARRYFAKPPSKPVPTR